MANGNGEFQVYRFENINKIVVLVRDTQWEFYEQFPEHHRNEVTRNPPRKIFAWFTILYSQSTTVNHS